MFYGAIIGAIIGVLIDLTLNLLNVAIGNMTKLAIVVVCIVLGMVLLAIHNVKTCFKTYITYGAFKVDVKPGSHGWTGP